MNPRNWLLLTVSTIVAAVGIVVTTSYAADPFGVWHDPSGRKLVVYFDQKKAKFLMNMRYVPSNFDGLLIGSSVTANWDVPPIGDIRIYNESLSGANAADEEALVSQALAHRHYKLALVLLTPFVTHTHDIKEAMDATKVTESLGSLAVLENEAGLALASAHIHFRDSDLAPNGQITLHNSRNLHPVFYEPSHYEIDPIALNKYQALVQSLQASGAQVVYFVLPTYEPCYELNKQGLDAYTNRIRALLPPAPVIDLSDPKFAGLRSDPNDFIDCVHFAPQGAGKIIAILPDLVTRSLSTSDGRIH